MKVVTKRHGKEVQKYGVVRIADEFVVDSMTKACGIDFEEASKETEFFEIENVRIEILGTGGNRPLQKEASFFRF